MQHYWMVLLLCSCIIGSSLDAVKLGVENISPQLIAKLKKQKVGLLTNQSGKDQRGKPTLDIVRDAGISVSRLFVPEHGLQGMVPAGSCVHDTVHTVSGIPVISLYGEGIGKKLGPITFADVDVLLFDIQDAGMRHYTYISTLLHAMRALVGSNKKLIVFDRPNPLGAVMEGPLVEKEYESFISVAPIPLRHGLTIGELARYFNTVLLEQPIDLEVVPMHDYERNQQVVPHALNLSPNITNRESCYGYSFLGLLGEVRPFHVAVGTDKAFQCVMLHDGMNFPKHKWAELHALLKQFHVNSISHSYFNPKTKKQYQGLRLIIEDINKVPAFTVFLAIVQFFKKAGISLSFADSFDKAIGTKKIRDLLQGCITYDEMRKRINHDLVRFHETMQPILLYKPLPRAILLV